MSDQPQNDGELDPEIVQRLRERGIDPQSLTLEQMVELMQEAVQNIISTLQGASKESADLEISQELQVLVDQARELGEDLDKLHKEVDDKEENP